MTIRDAILNKLANSHELSRSNLCTTLGYDREKLRKPLTKLIEEGKIVRRVDDDGIEWFTVAEPKKAKIIINMMAPPKALADKTEPAVDAIEPSVKEGLQDKMQTWAEGYASGYDDAWADMGLAIAGKLREFLSLKGKENESIKFN